MGGGSETNGERGRDGAGESEAERQGDPEFDPEAPEEREIGREMVDRSTGLGSVMAHFYRGEMSRVTTWRQRLDQTTNWAVTVIAAVLVYAFSTSDASHVVLLVGLLTTVIFLAIEARRYQGYDVWRSRVRLLQENLFANALDPSAGVERDDWRRELSDDFRDPTIKMPYVEAVQRRLRRVYLPLFGVLLAAWLFRVAAYAEGPLFDAAAVGAVPGPAVVGAVTLFAAAVVALAAWPLPRRAKGEFGEREYGTWKE